MDLSARLRGCSSSLVQTSSQLLEDLQEYRCSWLPTHAGSRAPLEAESQRLPLPPPAFAFAEDVRQEAKEPRRTAIGIADTASDLRRRRPSSHAEGSGPGVPSRATQPLRIPCELAAHLMHLKAFEELVLSCKCQSVRSGLDKDPYSGYYAMLHKSRQAVWECKHARVQACRLTGRHIQLRRDAH